MLIVPGTLHQAAESPSPGHQLESTSFVLIPPVYEVPNLGLANVVCRFEGSHLNLIRRIVRFKERFTLLSLGKKTISHILLGLDYLSLRTNETISCYILTEQTLAILTCEVLLLHLERKNLPRRIGHNVGRRIRVWSKPHQHRTTKVKFPFFFNMSSGGD